MKIKPTDITVEFVEKTGDVMSGTLTTPGFIIRTESLNAVEATRWNPVAGNGCSISLSRARGTEAAPEAVKDGDVLGGIYANGLRDSGAWSGFGGALIFDAVGDRTTSNTGTSARIRLVPQNGSTIQSAVVFSADTGISFMGDVVVDVDRRLKLRDHLVAALPPANTRTGYMVYVSDAAGGASPAFSNGTNWISLLTGAPV